MATPTLIPMPSRGWRREPEPTPRELARQEFDAKQPEIDADMAAYRARQAADAERAALVRGFNRRRDRRAPAPIRKAWHVLLLHRAHPAHYPLPDAAHEWRDHTLMDLAAHDLDLRGIDSYSLGRAGVVTHALERGIHGFVRVSGYQTAADFPSVLDGVARTLYLDGYSDAPRTFTPWCAGVEVGDFRATYVLATAFPALRAVPEHAEYTRAPYDLGAAEPLRLMTFGRTVSLSRQMVLANDLVSFTRLVDALGVAAAALESDAVYDLLTSNPALADGQPLFSAAHGNLMPAGPLDASTLATACTALAAQPAPSGEPLHLAARYLVCGPALAPTARTLCVPTAPADPEAAATAGALQVVCEPRIPTGWYVTAAPTQRTTLVYAHLAAEPEPVLEARDDWDHDGREFKGRHDFGCAVGDWRGIVFTPAA